MEQRDFFISYTKTDEDWAVWIAHTLDKHGYTSYVQALDIHPGDDFLKKMEEFLENSRNFLAVWSKKYSESDYCMQEFRAAFTACRAKEMGCLLPVRVENQPLKRLYSTLVHADLFGKESTAAEKELLNAVRYATSHSDMEERPDDVTNRPQPPPPRPTGRPFPVRLVMKWALILVCIAALLLIGNAIRPRLQDMLEGYKLYQTGENYYSGKNGVEQDYTKAREYWEQAAAKGNASALNNLGWLYSNGYGVEKDYAKAREYYEQAAVKGHAPALDNLGFFYEYGYGVEQDYAKAREYYEQAATKGHAPALNNLGLLYYDGKGVAQDYAKAREYWEQAVAKGNVYALSNLGILYEYGRGVEQDYSKALEYYQKAVDAGYELAAASVARVQKMLNA